MLLCAVTFLWAGGTLEPQDPFAIFRTSFRVLLDQQLTGLPIEFPNPEALQNLLNRGREFVTYFKRPSQSETKASMIAECLAKPDENPFCAFLGEGMLQYLRSIEDPEFRNPRGRRGPSSVQPSVVLEKLYNSDFTGLDTVSRAQVQRLLRHIPEPEDLIAVSLYTLKQPSCAPVALLTGLALKAEEFLPESRFRDLAIQLYERADACAERQSDEISIARYRLGLLYIWAGNCAKADSYLQKLSTDQDGDFYSRVIYWRAWCAKQMGSLFRFRILRNRLLKANPLGFHTLNLNEGRIYEIESLVSRVDMPVQFRSKTKPELNRMVLAVELLLKLEEPKLASHVLSMIEDGLDGTEPSFRLYVAELSRRNGSMIQPFRILSTAFRDDPLLISHDTMQVFYPLKAFPSLAAHADKVDPFLVAALIRQESGFNATARSRVGALGLMQIMPATARRMAKVSKVELLRPEVNIKLGIRYFRGLLDRFGGDAELALAAYNAGPKNVDEWIRRYPTENRLLFLDMIPFTETRNYVALIGRNFFWYQKLYQEQEKQVPLKDSGRETAAAANVFFKSAEFLR